MNIKHGWKGDVDFDTLIFACVNPMAQDAVLPPNTSSDALEKILFFNVPPDHKPTPQRIPPIHNRRHQSTVRFPARPVQTPSQKKTNN